MTSHVSELGKAVQPKSFVIGTAGHIDHGKTTLIHALTGIDTDRLPEEKRRGITIDLGFASLETIAADRSPLRLSFIDVPGHHLFIRNMLAGAGGIDAVMLIISAEEGVKPQTEEHLAICNMLGVRAGLTVITKTDAVNTERLVEICDSVRQFLSGTFLDRASIIPVSAYSGSGLDNLRSALTALTAQIAARNSDAWPRLPVDRAFIMKGFGTVVTGTLLAGSFKNGQILTIEPGDRQVRVRGIQVHGHPEETAHAGSRVALNLAGIDASEVHRGDTVLQASTLVATNTIDVEASLLPDVPELKHRSRVHFHAFASETIATVSLYQYQSVQAGSTRLMRLRLNAPIVLAPGDRFVLRQSSPAMTIGGGRVLDAHPIPKLRKVACLKWLEEITHASVERQLLLRIARRGTDGLPLSRLSVESGLTAEAVARLTRTQTDSGMLVPIGDALLIMREALESAAVLMLSRLKSRATASDASGWKRSELRSQSGVSDEIFDFVLEKLRREQKLLVRDEWVHLFGSSEQPKDRRLLTMIAEVFEDAGLASPSTEEVANKLTVDTREMRKLITLLLRDKTLVKLGNDDLYMHHHVLAKLRSQIGNLKGQTMDVGRFKQLTGLSRKYAIPLLEYLDREHITRKQGEHRLVL